MVGARSGEHLAVAFGVQDARDDDVIPGVQRVAGGQVDQADVRGAGTVVFPEDDAAEVVLTDQGQAPADLSRGPAATLDFPAIDGESRSQRRAHSARNSRCPRGVKQREGVGGVEERVPQDTDGIGVPADEPHATRGVPVDRGVFPQPGEERGGIVPELGIPDGVEHVQPGGVLGRGRG
ncbi:hypothetical protein STRIP9103_00218 [Streptomyces ipomoeae 91-03]|uniref:Uncharacterized protein n=1 Tax=Streptomyces ipomoeae 91-03 TaxID=698759 RepID=L1KPD6_9ACTN|nr:hypothetical protein STRIP9103_00218 [Streptomyces ipomoeae 91-03]